MRTKRMFVKLAAALLVWMTAVPVLSMAEAVPGVEAAKAVCVQAGGEVLGAGKAVKVVSPYGTQSVVLRDAPSDSYGAVAMLMVGQELTVVGTCGEFVCVLLEDGSAGWLAEDEVK